MRNISIAVLTFLLGVSAFNFLHFEEITVPLQETVEITRICKFSTPTRKVENSKSFFDSFGDNRYDEKSQYQGYSGWFMANDFKGMPEVWTILLDRDYKDSNNDKLIWSAMILTNKANGESNDDDNFQSVQIKTDGNHLSFRTNKIRGIEYRFDGEFFKTGKDFSDDEEVLKGTLQKLVKGKQVAKFTDEFSYLEPHCFH